MCKVSDKAELVWGLRVQIANELSGAAVKVGGLAKVYPGPDHAHAFTNLGNLKRNKCVAEHKSKLPN